MVTEVNCCHVLSRSTQNPADSAEASEVLLDDVLPVEGWGNVPAEDGGAVDRRRVGALSAHRALHGGCALELLIEGWFWTWKKNYNQADVLRSSVVIVLIICATFVCEHQPASA